MKNVSSSLTTSGTQVIIAIAAAVEIAFLGAAHADISGRDPSGLRGRKEKWRAITLIRLVDPSWYFLRGRR